MRYRKFTKEFKLGVLQELEAGKPLSELCRERELQPVLVCRWRREHSGDSQHAFSGRGKPSTRETRETQLERKIGQLCMEVDFVKRVNISLQNKLVDIKKTRGEKLAV